MEPAESAAMGSGAGSPFGVLRFRWLLLFGLVGSVLGGARPGGCPPPPGTSEISVSRAGTLGVTLWCLGAEGPGWGLDLGSGGGATPACVWTVLRPEARGLAPQTLVSILLPGSSSSVSWSAELFALRPTPISS